MIQPMKNFVNVQLTYQQFQELKHAFDVMLVKDLFERNEIVRNIFKFLQSRCFRFGPMISSVVALQTNFATGCPAIVFFAAKSRSTILCPPGCMFGILFYNKQTNDIIFVIFVV